MSKSYSQLLKQIAAMQEEADELRRKEVEGVVSRIREAIAVYNLSAADLGFAGAGRAKSPGKTRAAPKSGKGGGVVKYSNGAGGTWGGLGKRPQWLRDALESGKSLQDFLVK